MELSKNQLIEKIGQQKKFFKDSQESLCKKCSNYELDCFNAFKFCDPDQKTGLSKVVKCGSFNKEIETNYKESSIKVQNSADSRTEMMGGGFHLVDKYREEQK